MHCGLFGKLPSKRDFVSYQMERPFLDLWEGWLQTAIAVSREALVENWQAAFLNAPLWRFWLGSDIAGSTTAGVLMPSVDKIGRYFPLSICAGAPAGSRINPPPSPALDSWLQSVEQFLLDLLEDQLPDEPGNLLANLPFPETSPHAGPATSFLEQPVHTAWNGDIGALFRQLEAEDHSTLHGRRSYWWTMGGRDRPPQICVRHGMPNPSLFTSFLTGRFDGVIAP
jgi:type VI secretion system protein ImpM